MHRKRFLALMLAGAFLMGFSVGLAGQGGEAARATVLYQGHASLRVTRRRAR